MEIHPRAEKYYCLVVSSDKKFIPDPPERREKPVILIQNGIHSGEIEGKDACMLLLRDILVTEKKSELIENVTLLIIPVFNVDGHERKSSFNRINQNGPEEMGWRTTANNLNLNRDYMKADAPEMKALLKLYSSWLPDLLIDTHTTDGADYQYTITYDIEYNEELYSETREWIRNKFIPYFESGVKKAGYLIAPYVSFIGGNPANGLRNWTPTPRFSNGYTVVQNRPGLLIETHMLKPYKDRVYSTLALIESAVTFLNKTAREIVQINKKADDEVIKQYAGGKGYLPIEFKNDTKAEEREFLGFQSYPELSSISGDSITFYSDIKEQLTVPFYYNSVISDSILLPKSYWVPKEWNNLIDIMKLHGILVDTLEEALTVNTEGYKFSDVSFPSAPYEGRFMPSFKYRIFSEEITVPKGSYIVSLNQRTAKVIGHLLEPGAPDSFLKWGFLNVIFEQKEYFDDYSMEPIAKIMMEEDQELRKEFEERLSEDEKFRGNPRQRLNFFYERSEYFDKQFNVYPVRRIILA